MVTDSGFWKVSSLRGLSEQAYWKRAASSAACCSGERERSSEGVEAGA
jgi:hypothetical protein